MVTSSISDLLAQRQFVRFWLARLSGTTAMQMLMVALGWQIYDITSSAWDLGLVGLFQFVPALLLTLPAGHVADRVHRGHIFAACMLTEGVAALLLAAASQGGFATRELILAISAVLGVVRAFQMTAQQALGPLLVPTQMLPRAIALSSGGMQAAIICGPALGGALYVTGATTVYVCGAVLALLSDALALAVTGAADSISVVTRTTLVQLETPDEMRGRVGAVNSLFIGTSNQLGEFESGATAALLGPVASVGLGGIGTLLVAALWLRLFPALAQRDRMI